MKHNRPNSHGLFNMSHVQRDELGCMVGAFRLLLLALQGVSFRPRLHTGKLSNTRIFFWAMATP